MKKTTLLFVSFLIGATTNSSAQFNAQQAIDAPVINEESPVSSAARAAHPINVLAGGDTVFYENFSSGIPAGWTQQGPNQIWKWAPSTYVLQGCYSTGSARLNSTTSATGTMIFDADSANRAMNDTSCSSGGASYLALTGSLISASIDLTSVPSVKLRFQQRFRLCCTTANTKVTASVSGDGGSTWTDFDAQHGVVMNQYPATNSDPIQFDISAVAGGKSNVKIKFTFTAGSGTYFWEIDDIALVENFPNDLALTKGYNDMSYIDGGYYTMIPLVQAKSTPMEFRGAVLNDGALQQTGVHVNVDIKRNGSSLYNNSSAVRPTPLVNGEKDTLGVSVPFIPPATGTYTTTWTVQQNEAEDVPSNNAVSKTFVVTGDVYARDNDIITGTAISPSGYVGGNIDGAGIGNLYDIHEQSKVTSVSFYVESTTGIGAAMMAAIYPMSLTGPTPNVPQAESDIYDVITAGDRGKWVTLPIINGDLTLLKDSTYIVAVRSLNEATASMRMRISSDLVTEQPPASSWLLYNSSSVMTWGWISALPRIRLNLIDPDGVNEITGTCFIDLNSNNIKDGGESGIEGIKVTSVNNQYQVTSISSSVGSYSTYTDTGLTVTSAANLKYYTCTSSSHNSNFASYKNTDSYNFAFVEVPNVQDLRISLIPLTPARPGRDASYKILYENIGTKTMSGSVILVMNSGLTYVSASPAYNLLNADTIEWNYSNLTPNASQSIQVTLKVPTTATLGSFLLPDSRIEPVITDTIPIDNISSLKQLVTGSFDPNDKAMLQGEDITIQQVADAEYMNYMIRFQNTGTDTAFQIVVLDTLDSKLDWNSFEMVSSSHPNSTSIRDNRYIAWTFDNILLPDSNVDEPGSHGYICYRIKPKNNLVAGDEIKNTAHIYFDYNAPVPTNTVITTISSPVLIKNVTSFEVQVFPNPNSGFMKFIFAAPLSENAEFSVYNLLGEKVKTFSVAKGTDSFDLNESFTEGLYFYQFNSKSFNSLGRFAVLR